MILGATIYMFKITYLWAIETLEKGMKYVQN